MGELEGKTAIVTGAARGTGAAIAKRFVELGARVLLGDVREEEGEEVAEALGEGARFLRQDVTRPASLAESLQALEQLLARPLPGEVPAGEPQTGDTTP